MNQNELQLLAREVLYFIEVAEKSSITAASTSLGLSQPSLSAAIQRLEKTVGCKLLERGRSGVRLTTSGETLYRELLLSRQQMKRTLNLLHSNLDTLAGNFVIGCHPLVARAMIPRVLSQLHSQSQDLHVTLKHGLSSEVQSWVASGTCEFGIVGGVIVHEQLIAHFLTYDTNDAYQSHKEKSSKELELIYNPGMVGVESLLKKLRQSGFTFRHTITSSDYDVISEIAAQGSGVALLPTEIARRYPSLRSLKLARSVDRIPFYLIYKAELRGRRVTREILKILNFKSQKI